ncbi:MAG TPA: DUF6529 family protein [Solirubrobacterales bacterium]|nr:DUF6529 family protein [Solirubrobacterales bacterium]
METVIQELTRGNATEVKVILASVVAALAVYQVALMAVGYGKVKPRFLGGRAASFAHRAIGDALVVIVVVVAVMCVSYFGIEDDAAVHSGAAVLLLVALAMKVGVVRGLPRLHRFLPVLGLTIWVLIGVVFATSAGDFLWSR